ncbi:MAG: acetyl-CoA carboxylase biotin carboxyl carrier protein subunit [Oligoflexia bacterium]
MKFQFRVSGKKFVIEGSECPSSWTAELRPGGWVILERIRSDGSTERKRVSLVEKGAKLSVLERSLGPLFGDITRQSAASGASRGAGSDADFTAQFPGKVRKVLVKDGARVVAGEKLLLLEAMKMEFAIQAHADGIVKAVKVAEGQQLSPGQLLLDFEEARSK